MGQFKPMVKMETTEPSVILKLKKGGKVKGGEGSEGHEPMQGRAHAMHEAMEAESGKAPKKPSMAERRNSMKPKMARKAMGGPMGAPMAPPMGAPAPMAPPMAARPPMAPPMAPMGRQALMGMPAGQRNLRAAMVRKALTGMKKGGSTSSAISKLEKELHHHESLSLDAAHPQRKANGGTIGDNVSKFAKTKVDDGDKNDGSKGTGGVRMGNAGGFASGGTIGDNVSKFAKTKVVDGDKNDGAKGSGGVKNGNGGGFASGGNVNWENRPADTASAGKSNTTTGGVKNGNGGGFKRGGSAAKKAYATGGKVDDGKAVKMPKHSVSRPVANTLQSGTFANGGKVGFDEGGSADMSKGAYDRHYENEKAENEADRKSIIDLPKRLYEGAKSLFSPAVPKPPAGSVTKTEKSVTVAPRKSGGKA